MENLRKYPKKAKACLEYCEALYNYHKEHCVEIKPCPFCGSKSTGIRMHPDKQRREAVFCDNCSAVGPASSSQDNAIVAWNKGAKK